MIVVIPTSGRSSLLTRTLRSLARVQQPESFREVRVVENGPPSGAEESVAAMRDCLPITYCYCAQPNKSAALNHAIRDLSEELVVFFDDDIRVSPSVLMAYQSASQGISSGRFFGGPFGCDYEQEPPGWLLRNLPLSAKGWESEDGHGIGPTGGFLGFNWAAFACDLKSAGGFDPTLGPGGTSGAVGQESDMQNRLHALGVCSQYVPEAMVWHYVPASRCTRQWALHRIFREGIQQGLAAGREKQLAGTVPRWVWRQYAESCVQYWSFHLFLRRPEARFPYVSTS